MTSVCYSRAPVLSHALATVGFQSQRRVSVRFVRHRSSHPRVQSHMLLGNGRRQEVALRQRASLRNCLARASVLSLLGRVCDVAQPTFRVRACPAQLVKALVLPSMKAPATPGTKLSDGHCTLEEQFLGRGASSSPSLRPKAASCCDSGSSLQGGNSRPGDPLWSKAVTWPLGLFSVRRSVSRCCGMGRSTTTCSNCFFRSRTV